MMKVDSDVNTLKLEHGNLTELSEDKLEQILRWRNSDQVRLNMINKTIIRMEDHYRWFHSMDRISNKYFVFSHCGQDVGLVYFNRINIHDRSCQWGFYLGERNTPQGTGFLMGCLALQYIFHSASMLTVHSEVLPTNYRSIKYHSKLGFTNDTFTTKDDELVFMKLIRERWDIMFSVFKEEGLIACEEGLF